MTIDSRINPEIAAHLARIQTTMASAHQLSAAQVRQAFDAMRMDPVEVASMNEIRDLSTPAPHGVIHCRLYKPTDQPNLPLLVWFHGGGWVVGNLDSADMTCRDIANKSGCLVLSVDYRLAPEHPFPAAYDDAATALHYAFENAATLGADKNRIAIGGDSAGANLAACACIGSKELDVKFQLLVYPVVEPDFSNPSYTENADNYGLTRDLMKWFWTQYIPDETQRTDARAVPLNGDLKNLPPAWVLTVQFDPLRDEGIKYAEALKRAGVQVESAMADDTVHGFFTMPTDGSAQARSTAAEKLRKALM